jgi:RNA polymerase sigma-70 factor, ECF subfamily
VTILVSPWLVGDEVAERLPDDTERALAVRATAGDRHALRAIYELHAPRIRRFVIDMLRDREAASDALQDTFIRVFQRISTLEDPSRLLGWMFGIARRVCQEQRRSAARRARNVDPLESGLAAVHDPQPNPEAALAGARTATLLEKAIGELSADRRALLLMRCDHLLSYQEIALAMGFTVAKVKIEIFRARATLREALDQAEKS